MKKILPFVLLILYPNIVAASLAISFSLNPYFYINSRHPLRSTGYVILILLFVACIICTIVGLKNLKRQEISTDRILFLNMIIKLLHIPAFMLNFIIAIVFICMFYYRIALRIAIKIIIVNCTMLILSGSVGLVCVNKLRKQGRLSFIKCVCYGICQYIFYADIISAIVLYAKNTEDSENTEDA